MTASVNRYINPKKNSGILGIFYIIESANNAENVKNATLFN